MPRPNLGRRQIAMLGPIAQDTIGYVLGAGLPQSLALIPLPIGAVWHLYVLQRQRRASRFVDWDSLSWNSQYEGEIGNTVTISWEGQLYRLPQVWYLNNTDDAQDIATFTFEVTPNKFAIPDDARARTEKAYSELVGVLQKGGKMLNNETNVRLVGTKKDASGTVLQVQRVDYFDYVHTNLVLDAIRDKYSKSLRQVLHPDGKLEDLANSPLGNNLGVNFLLFTSDGKLVVPKRSKKVAFRAGIRISSASGTVSADDAHSGGKGSNIGSVVRELAWELLCTKGLETLASPPSFLGITRELVRGGEPEMFFSAVTKMSEREVIRAWESAPEKWESAGQPAFIDFGDLAFRELTFEDSTQLKRRIDGFIDWALSQSRAVPLTLLTNIALWSDIRTRKFRNAK